MGRVVMSGKGEGNSCSFWLGRRLSSDTPKTPRLVHAVCVGGAAEKEAVLPKGADAVVC